MMLLQILGAAAGLVWAVIGVQLLIQYSRRKSKR